MEVSFDFDATASAKGGEGADAIDDQQRDQEADEADREEGSVDLEGGGHLENSAWDGADDEESDGEETREHSKRKEQKETIEAEGGTAEQSGETELEPGEERHGDEAREEAKEAADHKAGTQATSEGQPEDTVSTGARV